VSAILQAGPARSPPRPDNLGYQPGDRANPGVGCWPAGGDDLRRRSASSARSSSRPAWFLVWIQPEREPEKNVVGRPGAEAAGSRPRMLSVSISKPRGGTPGSVRAQGGEHPASPSRCHVATLRAAVQQWAPSGRCGNRRLPASPPGFRGRPPPEGSGGPFHRRPRRWLSPLGAEGERPGSELPRFGHMGPDPRPSLLRST